MRYDYECQKGHTFEAEQSIKDPALTQCPLCENPVKRLLSVPAISFKGSGWAKDGYSSAPSKK